MSVDLIDELGLQLAMKWIVKALCDYFRHRAAGGGEYVPPNIFKILES